MALILTRSPFFVSRGSLDDGASLVVEIGDYDGSGFNVEKTYTFNYRNAYLIDVAPFIDDYLSDTFSWVSSGYQSDRGNNYLKYVRTTLSGEVSGVAQADVVNEYFASKGYLYSTDEYNEDLTQKLVDDCYYAGSSDVIYKLDDSQLRFPLMSTDQTLIAGDTGRSVDITYKNNGEVVKSITENFCPIVRLATTHLERNFKPLVFTTVMNVELKVQVVLLKIVSVCKTSLMIGRFLIMTK